ncbi:MAG: tail fiber domain-containing protein [Chloroflexota bacterium]
MPNIQINQLPAVTSLAASDSFAVWDDSAGVTARISRDNMAAALFPTGNVIRDDGTVAMAADFQLNNFRIASPSQVTLAIGSVSKATVNSTGLGFGTQNPATPLHIYDGSSGVASVTGDTIAILENDSNSYLAFRTPDVNESGFYFAKASGFEAGKLAFTHSDKTLRLTIDGTVAYQFGPDFINIGDNGFSSTDFDSSHTIGKTSFGYGGILGSAMFAHRNYFNSTDYGFRQNSDGSVVFNTIASQELSFRVGNVEQARINGDGELGIGENSPDAKLHIKDADAGGVTQHGGTLAIFEHSGNTVVDIRSGNTSSGFLRFSSSSTGNDGHIRYDNQFQLVEIGLGTGSLGYMMQQASFNTRTDAAATLGGPSNRWTTVYATTGTINTSDKQEKKNIRNSKLGLSFINGLRPVSYKWKKDGVRDHYGLIAQEVRGALAVAGVETDQFAGYIDDRDGGKLGLRYAEFIAPMIKAIQELSTKIEQMESKL